MSDFGQIRDYIKGASIKKLTAVECEKISNQHELNGTAAMRSFLGQRNKFSAKFIRLEDDSEKIATKDGEVTWYVVELLKPGQILR